MGNAKAREISDILRKFPIYFVIFRFIACDLDGSGFVSRMSRTTLAKPFVVDHKALENAVANLKLEGLTPSKEAIKDLLEGLSEEEYFKRLRERHGLL